MCAPRRQAWTATIPNSELTVMSLSLRRAAPNVTSPHMNRCFIGAILTTVVVSVAGYAAEYSVAAASGCVTVRLGETTVATLRNAPIVTLSANGAPVTLVIDTGAQGTILTPAVAQRIGAQRPRIEFQRQLHGIAGTLPTDEVELHASPSAEWLYRGAGFALLQSMWRASF